MTREHQQPMTAADCLPEDAETRHLLEARARNLAKVVVQKKQSDELVTYVCFTLGQEDRYGIPISYVQAIISAGLIAKPPSTPDLVVGVINWRGQLITILDLKKFFRSHDIGAATHTKARNNKLAYILIVSKNNMTLGFLVDNVYDSGQYEPSDLEKPLNANDAVYPEYLSGLHHGTTAIINIEQVMTALSGQLMPKGEP